MTDKKPSAGEQFAKANAADEGGFDETKFSENIERLRRKTKKQRDAKKPGEDERKPKQADLLIAIAKRGTLFHNHEDVAFADIGIGGHRETWPIRSLGYRRWLLHCYFNEHHSAPNGHAISEALGVIEAEAAYRGAAHPVAVRVGGHGDKIYLDLCDREWRAVEIDGEGWRCVDKSPIRFIRSRGMLPLPTPVKTKKTRDGIRALKDFINVKDNADFALAVAWVLAGFRPHGPYPVLAFIAQHGSAKSTSARSA